MGDPAFELVDISIDRGSGASTQRVFDHFNLSVDRGEVLAILGASGRGKSTLLHAIAGVLPLASGSLRGLSAQPGLVFQDALLLPWLTVRKNIALAYQFKANYADADAAAVSRRIDHLLAVTGLTELASRAPSELSGGQAQRVAIARALLHNPEVLLLDEPFSALDAVISEQLHELVRRTRDDFGSTIVLVTHDIESALTIADRVIVLTEAHQFEEIIPDRTQHTAQQDHILAALGGSYVI